MENATERLLEMLNEEKWTRATINSYTINNFEELDKFVEACPKEELNDLKEECDNHLAHTKNSIIALYISGIVSLKKRMIDDTNLIQLINIFTDNRKWKLVEYLCKKILEFGENKSALRLLASCYENTGEEEKKFEVWERLVKVDYDENEIVRQIAERYDEQGNDEKAVIFYKKALHRFITYKNFSQIKEIWDILLEKVPEEYEFFVQLENKVSTVLSEDRANQLLLDFYYIIREQGKWDKSIELLKKYLHREPKANEIRNELINCYREKFSKHSKLESYISESNLLQSYRNVEDAISFFEKHIAFDTGNFVYHKTWGIGKIRSIKGEQVIIDFSRKRGHEMTLKMAVNALTVLKKSHIWVIKSIWPKEKLHSKVKNDIPWTLRIIIRSYDNSASIKNIKAELVPSVLSKNEWLAWNTNARKILKTDPMFGNNPEKADEYVVRETPISYEEKTLNLFKGEKNFYQKVKILREFLTNSEPDSTYFEEIFNYFFSIVNSFTTLNDQAISSYLVLKRLKSQYGFLPQIPVLDIIQNFSSENEIISIFRNIDDSEIKRDFLVEVKKNHEDWQEIFKKLLPYYQTMFIIDELEEDKEGKNKIKELFEDSINTYREKPELFVWLTKNFSETEWGSKGIQYERVMIPLLHLLDITFRNISNKKEVSFNRKLNKNIQTILFEDKLLDTYIKSRDEDAVYRIYSLVKDVEELDPARKIELKHTIKNLFPYFKFLGEDDKSETVSGGLLVTEKFYYKRQNELKHILDVEIPENSKEIGVARELGDLKENAEYKAGKERQQLLNISVGKIRDELEKAVIFNPRDLDSTKISFGTYVELINLNTNKNEEYRIFGPLESDPSRKILSYLSPFGSKLLNHTVGETFSFTINDNNFSYRVKNIEAADIP